MDSFANLGLKQKILIHICYRDIFNFPVHENELKEWLGFTTDGKSDFNLEIEGLISENLICYKDQFFFLRGKGHLLEERKAKKTLAEDIIKECAPFMKFISRIPFITYLGISGSVAAGNPTLHKTRRDRVDLDIFLVTRPNSLWIPYFLLKLMNVLFILFRINKYYLCFNYAMDEAFLEIHNKNFFTATELYNLSTLYGTGYGAVVAANSWAAGYYPLLSGRQKKATPRSFHFIVRKLNFVLFALFQASRCLKRKNLQPILEIKSTFIVSQRHNLRRVCSPNGGYQELIKAKFIENFKENFARYYEDSVADVLFPGDGIALRPTKSEIFYHQEVQSNFSRYA